MRKIIPYNPVLKQFARQLRNNSTRSEIRLWQHLKNKSMGYQFNRQKPLLNFIADFYCYDLKLIIVVDGYTHQFEGTWVKDKIKETELQKIGLSVLRFSDEDVMGNLEGVISFLRDYIQKYEDAN